MIDDDEYLERIVAGIQSLTTSRSDAEVNWNEKIDGSSGRMRLDLIEARYRPPVGRRSAACSSGRMRLDLIEARRSD